MHFLIRIRGVGSAAINMCLVASGCVEAYYEIGIHCWDIAAGAVIVSEAGGVLKDFEGEKRYIVYIFTVNDQLSLFSILANDDCISEKYNLVIIV